MKKLLCVFALISSCNIFGTNVPVEFIIKHKDKLKEITEINIRRYPTNYYMQKTVSEQDFESFYEMYQIREKLGISNE